jgi:mannitol/fructose-specific phosphotransferase system IIA component
MLTNQTSIMLNSVADKKDDIIQHADRELFERGKVCAESAG